MVSPATADQGISPAADERALCRGCNLQAQWHAEVSKSQAICAVKVARTRCLTGVVQSVQVSPSPAHVVVHPHAVAVHQPLLLLRPGQAGGPVVGGRHHCRAQEAEHGVQPKGRAGIPVRGDSMLRDSREGGRSKPTDQKVGLEDVDLRRACGPLVLGCGLTVVRCPQLQTICLKMVQLIVARVWWPGAVPVLAAGSVGGAPPRGVLGWGQPNKRRTYSQHPPSPPPPRTPPLLLLLFLLLPPPPRAMRVAQAGEMQAAPGSGAGP